MCVLLFENKATFYHYYSEVKDNDTLQNKVALASPEMLVSTKAVHQDLLLKWRS